jgi:hypothetical protein
MELIFLAGAAAVVWLYLFNTTLCYVLVGGGYVAILVSLLASKIQKARSMKLGMASVRRVEPDPRVSSVPGPGMVAGGGQ